MRVQSETGHLLSPPSSRTQENIVDKRMHSMQRLENGRSVKDYLLDVIWLVTHKFTVAESTITRLSLGKDSLAHSS